MSAFGGESYLYYNPVDNTIKLLASIYLSIYIRDYNVQVNEGTVEEH